jgi:tricorn protease
MNDKGYYNHPAINGNNVYFTSEDDLWSVPSAGGIARRLTSGLGWSSYPAVSPDGRWLAFSATDEGVRSRSEDRSHEKDHRRNAE